jgi:hypothetical protein
MSFELLSNEILLDLFGYFNGFNLLRADLNTSLIVNSSVRDRLFLIEILQNIICLLESSIFTPVPRFGYPTRGLQYSSDDTAIRLSHFNSLENLLQRKMGH